MAISLVLFYPCDFVCSTYMQLHKAEEEEEEPAIGHLRYTDKRTGMETEQ